MSESSQVKSSHVTSRHVTSPAVADGGWGFSGPAESMPCIWYGLGTHGSPSSRSPSCLAELAQPLPAWPCARGCVRLHRCVLRLSERSWSGGPGREVGATTSACEGRVAILCSSLLKSSQASAQVCSSQVKGSLCWLIGQTGWAFPSTGGQITVSWMDTSHAQERPSDRGELWVAGRWPE